MYYIIYILYILYYIYISNIMVKFLKHAQAFAASDTRSRCSCGCSCGHGKAGHAAQGPRLAGAMVDPKQPSWVPYGATNDPEKLGANQNWGWNIHFFYLKVRMGLRSEYYKMKCPKLTNVEYMNWQIIWNTHPSGRGERPLSLKCWELRNLLKGICFSILRVP